MSDLLENLNEAQKVAVTHGDGPLLIVAGAGTGKTTVLTRRYAHLLQTQNLSTENILALTFTDKSANEMEDRVIQLLPTGAYDFWISTFHGFCQRILEAHGLEIGLPQSFRLLNETDAWLLLKRRFAELSLEHYRPLGNPVRFLRALLQHISRAKDEGVTPERYLEFVQNAILDGDTEAADGERRRLQELADLYVAYRRIMLEEGALDFGDLILETLRLLRTRPNVLEKYRHQFHTIMVDEFQDTNWAQYELVKLLAGTRKNLTVVGDDDQAIYKFRGASLANILQFRDDFPDAKAVALTDNYRSRREILDVAYSFIRKNDPNRLEVKLQNEGLSKRLTAMRGEGGAVNVAWCRSVEDEADATAEKIKELKNREPETGWNDFAVLVRSNDSAEPFVGAFERAGIPFQFLALRGLYAKSVILDIVALLSLLDGQHESSAVWRALNLDCYPFPQADLRALINFSHENNRMPLWVALKQETSKLQGASLLSDDGRKIGARLVQDVELLAECARRESPIRVLQKTLDKSGYMKALMRLPEQDKREAIQWLNAFADRLKRYEASTHGPTLRDFLQEFRLEIESGEEGSLETDPEAGPELVKIMTVHASKGLEFKHVFLVSLVDQRFPSRGRSEAIPLPDGLVQERLPEGNVHLEEERRLFYVALTRAKDTLTLSGATRYGGTRAKKPSVFFEESGLSVQIQPDPMSDETKRLLPPQIESQEETSTNTSYQLKRRFSFTQLAAFNKCPRQYQYAHIYRIPILGNANKSFGNSLHLALQHILELQLARLNNQQLTLLGGDVPLSTDETQSGLKVSEEEALEIFEAAWQGVWYDSPKEHDERKTEARRAIRQIWRKWSANPPQVLELEKSFTLIFGEHSIKGTIDRVDKLPDGSVQVYDYKTGKAKESLDAEAKKQLHLYQIALEERGLKVARLAYSFVLDDVELEVEPLVGDAREKFITKLTDIMDEILVSDFTPTPEPFTCRFCDFKEICDKRKL